MIASSLGLLLALTPGIDLSPGWILRPLGPDTACVVMDMSTEGRLSPLDSLTFAVAGMPVKICYGRPSARGRTMIGGKEVPFGRLWRTGANEPTMIHTTIPLSVGGIEIDVGSYSLYTIPDEEEWTVILNRSITQWGHIARYTYRVRQQEVGRVKVQSQRLESHVETMTIRAEPGYGGDVILVLEWEWTRLPIQVSAMEKTGYRQTIRCELCARDGYATALQAVSTRIDNTPDLM